MIHYSVSGSERLCDVAILLPRHNVSLIIGGELSPRFQHMQIVTESCGKNIGSLKLSRVQVDVNGVLGDLNIDKVVFKEVIWFDRPSNKPTCSAKLVKLVARHPVEFEIFNFPKIQQLHWKSKGTHPFRPTSPLRLLKNKRPVSL
jgi:hypothetical protein